jgi:uncharacterized protein involved in exopolysaccharide biosynthesis
MSTDLTQAVADARQAETQAAQLAQILAVVQAAQAPRRSAGTVAAWVAGGAACACVLTGLFLAVALVAVAVTVGGCIGYLLIREIRKGK